MTLKVDQGHWRWHNSIGHISCVTVCLSRIISEIFNVEQWHALEICVRDHSLCDAHKLNTAESYRAIFCRYIESQKKTIWYSALRSDQVHSVSSELVRSQYVTSY